MSGLGTVLLAVVTNWVWPANWGEPNEDSLGQDLDDQYTFEVYYRLQLTEQLALTPDIQYLVDPAQNPDEDKLWIFGLRARLAL